MYHSLLEIINSSFAAQNTAFSATARPEEKISHLALKILLMRLQTLHRKIPNVDSLPVRLQDIICQEIQMFYRLIEHRLSHCSVLRLEHCDSTTPPASLPGNCISHYIFSDQDKRLFYIADKRTGGIDQTFSLEEAQIHYFSSFSHEENILSKSAERPLH